MAGCSRRSGRYFVALRAEVEKRKDQTPDRLQAAVPAIRDALLKQHATYIDTSDKAIIGFESQVAQVYRELTGRDLSAKGALDAARRMHEQHHGIAAGQQE